MKLTVYMDILLITNIIINYMLLKITVVVAGIVAYTKKLIFSATIGSFFSLIIFADISFGLSLRFKFFSVVLCGFIAFGFNNFKIFIRNILYLLSVNMIFAGAIIAILQNSQVVYMKNFFFYFSINPVLLVGCILFIYILITIRELIFAGEKEYIYEVYIHIDNKILSAKAFYDTGFKVKDILSHRGIILCSFDFLKDKPGTAIIAALENFFNTGQYSESYIIPVFYSDISDSGILPAIKTEKIIICGKNKNTELKNILIAVCKQNMLGEYQIIFGKEIYNMIGE